MKYSILFPWTAAVLLLGFCAPSPRPGLRYDVLVYGGTSAGVIAAYTAKMYGKSVLLVEPGRHLGGMSTGGLGQTDIGNKQAITGLSRDFYRRLGAYYGQIEAWKFEPHAAGQVFEDYIDRAQVEVLYSRRVRSVQKKGAEIRAVTLEYAGEAKGAAEVTVTAGMFIDTSYEGDLMALAGVSYAVGREPNSAYGETHDGVEMNHPQQYHQFPDSVDPYITPGDQSSGLLPEITGAGIDQNGSGDKKIQAYNFRMCLTQDTSNMVPVPEPPNYDPGLYELLIRLMEKKPWESLRSGFIISPMPNGKTDWNNYGGFSTDYIGRNWDYPEADYARRTEIWREHREYQQGLLYFIAHDGRVPEKIRREMQSWGFCRDEFLDTGGWPHALYVREARRMLGEYVMTEHNCVGQERVADGVGMAAYTMDSHNTQRVVLNGMVKNEGDVEVGGFPPYPISYRSITPRREEAVNLLVPVALSASHIAFGSIRMEPVFMVLGQSAAVAASMALDAGVKVQEIDVPALQRELQKNPLAGGVLPEEGAEELRLKL